MKGLLTCHTTQPEPCAQDRATVTQVGHGLIGRRVDLGPAALLAEVARVQPPDEGRV